MKYSGDGIRLTERFESCKLVAYPDQKGVWTIAWGHTRGVAKGLTCSQSQADLWLWEDIGFAEQAVNSLVTVQLFQPEFDALVDFVFNLGAEDFRGSTLLRLLNAGNMEGAAAEFPKWDHCGGVEVAGLLRRRIAEQQDFESAFSPVIHVPIPAGDNNPEVAALKNLGENADKTS